MPPLPHLPQRLHTDVIIVGAGLAGLQAALELQKHKLDCIVLEARDRVGGRVQSAMYNGMAVDYGGQWISPAQRRIHGLLMHYGIPVVSTPKSGRTLYHLCGKTSEGGTERPPLPWLSRLDVALLHKRVEGIVKELDARAPWAHPQARMLDCRTMEHWLERHMHTSRGRAFYRLLSEEGLCGELSEFSALDVMWDLASAGGYRNILTAEDQWIPGGAQTLPERMAASLGKEAVRLGSPVRTVEWTTESVTVHTDGESWRGRRLIMAVPPAFSVRVEYSPALPAMRDLLCQRVGQGSVIKTVLVYGKPFWRDSGLNGMAYSDRGAVKATMDSTPPGQPKGVMTALITGRDARLWGERTAEERREEILRSLVRLFGSEAAAPLACHEKDWSADPWARGGYGAHFAPGVLTSFGRSLTEPVGPIHWAGAECASEWRLYMEGALQSGECAAQEVIRTLP